MTVLSLLSVGVLATSPSPAPAPVPAAGAPIARPVGAHAEQPPDTTRARRRRAVEISDGYHRRLTIHRIGSYTMLPLFAAQYLLGEEMLDQREAALRGERSGVSDGVRTSHYVVAGGVGALFVVNTVTGAMNLRESRAQPAGRARRTAHAIAMLAAEAGFVATGVLGTRAADRGPDAARTHRRVALASMGVSTASAAMMLLTRD